MWDRNANKVTPFIGIEGILVLRHRGDRHVGDVVEA